jgi:CheY-like chemotaxis protein
MENTILVVEDDIDLRSLLEEVLGEAGYRVALARDGAQGLHLARTLLPDLILCDILMPSMNGNQMVQALSRIPPCAGIPVVGMSAHSDDVDGGRQHYAMFLRKPFSIAHLLETIAALLADG